jgi:non-ribosomal peptide synthetase component F
VALPKELVVGSPIANRSHPEFEGLIGYFVNMLALRTRLAGDLTFQGLLGRIRETALGAYSHSELSFAKLVEELQPRRDPAHNPIFQVTFTLQNHLRPITTPELTMIPIESSAGGALFDLRLEVGEAGSGALPGFFEYNTDLFRPATIAKMAEQYQALLECAVANPAQTLSEILTSTGMVSRKVSAHQDDPNPVLEGLDSKKAQLLNRRATLSPEQQALLEKRLRGNDHG